MKKKALESKSSVSSEFRTQIQPKKQKKKWSFFSCCADDDLDIVEERVPEKQKRHSTIGEQGINTQTQNSNSLSMYDDNISQLMKQETKTSNQTTAAHYVENTIIADTPKIQPMVEPIRESVMKQDKSSLLQVNKSIIRQKYNIKQFFQSRNASDNEISHLYSKKDRQNYLLIKYKERNIGSPSGLSNGLASGSSNGSSIIEFGSSSKGYRGDFDSQYNAIPEQLSAHISERFKNLLVIDAFIGVAYNSIQFAKEASQVIGVDIDVTKLNHAKYNIDLARAYNKIEIVAADFLTLKRLKGDVVVLHPDFKQCENCVRNATDDAFNLECDVKPCLTDAINQAFLMAESVVLILHKKCNVSMLPDILSKTDYSNRKFGVEIELLHLQRQFSHAVIYLGKIADIQKNEEVEFYVEKLYRSTNFNNMSFKAKLRLVLIHLRDKMRISGVSFLIEECEIQVSSETNRRTLFQEFWDRISEKRQSRIRSSGNIYFDLESLQSPHHSANTDAILRTLIQEINDILSAKSKQYSSGGNPNQFAKEKSGKRSIAEPKNQVPHSIEDTSFNSHSFGTAKEGVNESVEQQEETLLNKKKKNIKFNLSLRYESDQKSPRFNVSKFSGAKNSLMNATTNPSTNNSSAWQTESITVKKSALKHSTEGEQKVLIDEQLLNQQEKEIVQTDPDEDEQEEEDYDDDYSQKIVYSCSYNTNTLVDSELSESNSLRPQQSNNYFGGPVGSSDFYDEQSMLSPGARSSVGSISNRVVSPNSFLAKSGKKNNIKALLDIDRSYSADQKKILQLRQIYQQQYDQDNQDADFCWTYEENDQQSNSRAAKTKNNNTYTNNDMETVFGSEKKENYTLPNSLS